MHYNMGNNYSLAEANPDLNFECFCCGQLVGNKSCACPFHLLCDACEIKSFVKKFTVCCLTDLTPDSIEEIKNRHGVCMKCNVIIDSGTTFICGCKLCRYCIYSKFINREIKCSKCCEKVARERFIVCFVCNEPTGIENSVRHRCGESICIKCIKQESGTLLPEHRHPNIYCPKCLEIYEEKTLIQLFGEEKTNEIYLKLISKNLAMITCPKCSEKYILENSHCPLYNCIKCRVYFCKDCQHELNKCTCPHDFNSSLNSFSIDKKKIINCPCCSRPYLREDNVLFQECADINCRFTFCTECLALKDQIDCHGTHYHQPNCKFYKSSGQVSQYNHQCSKCRELNKACRPPFDVNRQRFWST